MSLTCSGRLLMSPVAQNIRGSAEIIGLEGDHCSILREPHVLTIAGAERLRAAKEQPGEESTFLDAGRRSNGGQGNRT